MIDYTPQVGVSLAEVFEASNPVIDPLWTDLAAMIRHKYSNTPRHLQVALGPSETGHPCMRRMAYAMMQVPRCNPEWDPLPSIYGTAMHTWLEDAARMDNERLGRERWLMETRVTVTAGLSGSSDLYDTDNDTVIDWKNLGYTSFPEQVKNIDITYIGQLQQYGLGFRNLGYDVKHVAIAILPRTGTLSKMHLWKVAYDEQFAQGVLNRREAVMIMIDDFSVDVDPERYSWIPITPSKCVFCPWFSPNPRSPLQCSSKQETNGRS